MFHSKLLELPGQTIWLRALLRKSDLDQEALIDGFLVHSQDSTEYRLEYDICFAQEDWDVQLEILTSAGLTNNDYKVSKDLKSPTLSEVSSRRAKKRLEKRNDSYWYLQQMWTLSLPMNRNMMSQILLGVHSKWFDEDEVYVMIDGNNLILEKSKLVNESYVYLGCCLSYRNDNQGLLRKLEDNLCYKLYLWMIDSLTYKNMIGPFLNQFQQKSSWINCLEFDIGFHLYLLWPGKYRLNSFLPKVSYLVLQVINDSRVLFTDMLGRHGWGYLFFKIGMNFQIFNVFILLELNNILDTSVTFQTKLNFQKHLVVF